MSRIDRSYRCFVSVVPVLLVLAVVGLSTGLSAATGSDQVAAKPAKDVKADAESDALDAKAAETSETAKGEDKAQAKAAEKAPAKSSVAVNTYEDIYGTGALLLVKPEQSDREVEGVVWRAANVDAAKRK